MGSQQPSSAAPAPQQELPPALTRNAACPYFSFTTSLISMVRIFSLCVFLNKLDNVTTDLIADAAGHCAAFFPVPRHRRVFNRPLPPPDCAGKNRTGAF